MYDMTSSSSSSAADSGRWELTSSFQMQQSQSNNVSFTRLLLDREEDSQTMWSSFDSGLMHSPVGAHPQSSFSGVVTPAFAREVTPTFARGVTTAGEHGPLMERHVNDYNISGGGDSGGRTAVPCAAGPHRSGIKDDVVKVKSPMEKNGQNVPLAGGVGKESVWRPW